MSMQKQEIHAVVHALECFQEKQDFVELICKHLEIILIFKIKYIIIIVILIRLKQLKYDKSHIIRPLPQLLTLLEISPSIKSDAASSWSSYVVDLANKIIELDPLTND